ncbi:uncharacterized protein TNCV_1055351 [Trichonephila clavipes]|nr:uncharacterized protein TNCV_1055351 [Trichonephila clavipes]
MDEILTTDRDLELEVNEDDIEELIMGHEDELTIKELQEILNEEHQETQRNVSPSEQEEDERGPIPTSDIKDLFKKREAVRVNEDDIEELIMGHEDELTIEELQEILNEEHQETQRNVSPSEQEDQYRHLTLKIFLKRGRQSE